MVKRVYENTTPEEVLQGQLELNGLPKIKRSAINLDPDRKKKPFTRAEKNSFFAVLEASNDAAKDKQAKELIEEGKIKSEDELDEYLIRESLEKLHIDEDMLEKARNIRKEAEANEKKFNFEDVCIAAKPYTKILAQPWLYTVDDLRKAAANCTRIEAEFSGRDFAILGTIGSVAISFFGPEEHEMLMRGIGDKQIDALLEVESKATLHYTLEAISRLDADMFPETLSIDGFLMLYYSFIGEKTGDTPRDAMAADFLLCDHDTEAKMEELAKKYSQEADKEEALAELGPLCLDLFGEPETNVQTPPETESEAKPRKKKATQPKHTTPRTTLADYHNNLANGFPVGVGAGSDIILSILGGGIPNIKNAYRNSHSMQISLFEGENEYTHNEEIKLTAKKGKNLDISLTFDKALYEMKASKGAYTIFLIVLSQLSSSIHKPELHKYTIEFPLQYLVDIGAYESTAMARRGFNEAKAWLVGPKISGSATVRGNKNTIYQDAAATIIPFMNVENGLCTIDLNDRVNWNLFSQFVINVPGFLPSLSFPAMKLCFKVFYLANQASNQKKIAETGAFTISFKEIHGILGLPEPGATKNPRRDITDKIESAIEEIENKISTNEYNIPKGELQFEIVDDGISVKNFIETGKLSIKFSGSLLEKTKTRENTKQAIIKKEKERQEKIVDRAKEKAIATKIIEAESNEGR